MASFACFFLLLVNGCIKYGETVEKYKDSESVSFYSNRELVLEPEDKLIQEFVVNNGELFEVSLKYHVKDFHKGTVLSISLFDADNDELLNVWEEDGNDLSEDGIQEYRVSGIVKGISHFYLTIKSNKSTKALVCTEKDSYPGQAFYLNNDEQNGDLVLILYQRRYIKNTLIWGMLFSLLLGFSCTICLTEPVVAKKLRLLLKLRGVDWLKKHIRWIIAFLMIASVGVLCFSHRWISAVLNVNEFRLLFFFVLALSVVCFILFWGVLPEKPEVMFFVLFLVIGFLYIVSIPSEVETAWDESIHYWRAVGVSHALSGQANAAEGWLYWHYGIKYSLPNSIKELRELQDGIQLLYNENRSVSANTDILGRFMSVAYIPSAFGLWIGRVLRFPYHITFQLGAAMNMVIHLVLSFFSIKRVKSGKMVLVLLASLATPFFLAAVYSADYWVTGFMMLGSAYMIGVLQERLPVSHRDCLIMLGSFTLAVLPKMIYGFLFLLFLLIPTRKFETKKHRDRFRVVTVALFITSMAGCIISEKWLIIVFTLSICILNVVLKVIMTLYNRKKRSAVFATVILCLSLIIGGCLFIKAFPNIIPSADLRGGTDVNAAGQVRFILEHPFNYAKVAIRFLVTDYLSFDGGLRSPFQRFGYLGNTPTHYWAFVLLWTIAVLDKNSESWWKEYRVTRAVTFSLLLIFIGVVATSLYISFTPVADTVINGCQPRYMIPVFSLFFMLIGSPSIKCQFSQRKFYGSVFALTSAMSLFNLWMVVTRLYL